MQDGVMYREDYYRASDAWCGPSGNTRMYQALRDYGDRLDTVGIFTFEGCHRNHF